MAVARSCIDEKNERTRHSAPEDLHFPRLRLRYPEGGTETFHYTHENYADLTRWNFPAAVQEYNRALSTDSFNGSQRAPYALVRVVAMNQDGAATGVSKQEVQVTLTEYPPAADAILPLPASYKGADGLSLDEQPLPDISLRRASPLMSGTGLCSDCERRLADYEFEVFSDGIVFSCHHSNPVLPSAAESSEVPRAYFSCAENGSSVARFGEFSWSDGNFEGFRWLRNRALSQVP